jgi:hypothetical protein
MHKFPANRSNFQSSPWHWHNLFQAKRRTLEELLDFLRNLKGAITEKFYSELFALISANIFRDLPPREDEMNPMDFELAAQQQSGGPDDEPDFGNCPDPAWTHLEVI